jgi:DNA replication initiation complex subunit (GINS family)
MTWGEVLALCTLGSSRYKKLEEAIEDLEVAAGNRVASERFDTNLEVFRCKTRSHIAA